MKNQRLLEQIPEQHRYANQSDFFSKKVYQQAMIDTHNQTNEHYHQDVAVQNQTQCVNIGQQYEYYHQDIAVQNKTECVNNGQQYKVSVCDENTQTFQDLGDQYEYSPLNIDKNNYLRIQRHIKGY